MTTRAQDLAALEAEWQRLGVPTSDVLVPGLPEDEVRAGLQAGLATAPDDLVAWYTRQGGTGETSWAAAPLTLKLWSLNQALSDRDEQLNLPQVTDGAQWEHHWLPLTAACGNTYALDARSGQVLSVDWWAVPFARVVAPNLMTAVRYWTGVLREGYYRWTRGRWEYDFAAIPQRVRASGLVG
jgi:hypothetical protein